MRERVILLVLLAAVLHAVWNALLKGCDDRAQFMARMSSAMGVLALIIVPFVSLPARASWVYIAVSAFLHIGYNMLLLETYKTSDFGSAYPIARGISPLLVTLGAFFLMQQRPTEVAIAAIALISAGIIFLSSERTGGRLATLSAVATGASIAAYTVVDGMGVRVSQNTVSYTAWVFASYLLMPVVLAILGSSYTSVNKRNMLRPAGAGLLSLAAYALVLWATHYEPVGIVSVLRETSVLWAVVLSRFFLGEKVSLRRVTSAVMICFGVFLLIAKSK
jgi:drug/metabolite transporter (DMT)-like permease